MLTSTGSEGGLDGWLSSRSSGGWLDGSGGGSWDNSGGLNDTWDSDSQSGWARNSDSSWLADGVTLGDSDDGSVWAVGGVASDGNVLNNSGVDVSSQTGGRQSRDSSDSRELHYSE